MNKARLECQSYRLTYEDAPSVENLARYIARTQQKYTQRGGVRPFGVSCVIAGTNPDGTAMLYQTDPAGTYSAWRVSVLLIRFSLSLAHQGFTLLSFGMRPGESH